MPSTSNSRPVWDDGARLSLPSLEGEHTADVCVIGLGGSGLVCINELLRLGANVIGVDAAHVGGGAGGRNGGFLLAGIASFHHDAVASHGRTRASAMYQLTLEELDRITADTPELVRRVGSLRLAESIDEARDCERQRDAMIADGFAADLYEGPEGRGLLIGADGVFNPFKRCDTLARRALERGARLFTQSAIHRIEDGTAHADTGSVKARTVVVAVDGALPRVLPELAAAVRTARLQMLSTEPTQEISVPRPVYARWGYDYWQQLPSGEIALGGARDVGGEAEWTSDMSTTDVVQRALEERLRNILGVHAPVARRWSASVSYTRDELPIVREVRPSVWGIGAYSGTGNVVGSLLGRGVARLINTGDDRLIAPFRGAYRGA